MASLVAISRAAANRAKVLLARRLWFHAGTLSMGILAMFVREPYALAPLVIALFTEAGAWALRYRAHRHHALGEEARRLGVTMNAFGETRESAQAVDLRAKISRPLLKAAAEIEDPTYYASTAPSGRRRLVELLDESSFWSKHLYRTAAFESLCVSGAVVGALVIGGLIAEPFAGAGTALAVTRSIVIFLTLLFTVDELGSAVTWRHSAEAASCVNSQLEKIEVDHEPQLMTLFADYSVATATAAPIPQHIYEREKDRLNQLWQGRQSTRT